MNNYPEDVMKAAAETVMSMGLETISTNHVLAVAHAILASEMRHTMWQSAIDIHPELRVTMFRSALMSSDAKWLPPRKIKTAVKKRRW